MRVCVDSEGGTVDGNGRHDGGRGLGRRSVRAQPLQLLPPRTLTPPRQEKLRHHCR